MMKTKPLAAYLDLLADAGQLLEARIYDKEQPIFHITYDSRDVCPMTLFACKGAAFQVEYLKEAIRRGAVCCLSEADYAFDRPVSLLRVRDVRKSMALIAAFHTDYAFRKLHLIGITGTKGKSTTAYYLKYILDEYLQSCFQKPSGIISSIDTYDGKIFEESHLTTPEAFELHRHFANAVNAGIRYLEMEVSSQALKYDRVLGVEFETAVFLNISEDHISTAEHSDFEDYFGAKLKIFAQAGTAVVNLNSDHVRRVLDAARASRKLLTFGLYEGADVCGYDVQKVGEDTHFKVRTADFDEEFVLTMPGLFNVENALAAIAVCTRYGIPVQAMQEGLRKARSSGRMERFASEDGSRVVIVDYAHNKLSFQKLYESVQQEYPGRQVITVFGCPGGKAYNRRKELGELAGQHSDRIYLTMEDPGSEAVRDISREIEQHAAPFECERFLIDDRGEAITAAIRDSAPGSIILITGKGNETRQKIGREYVPCLTDAEYVRRALEQVGAGIQPEI